MGLITECIISVVGDNTPAGMRNAYMQIASYEILDSSGANVLGGSAVKEDFNTLVKQSRKAQSRALFACKFGQTDNNIVIEFGDSLSNQQSGIVSGYLPADGSLQLAITTPPDFPPSDYEVRVEYLACARLNINRGVVFVFTS